MLCNNIKCISALLSCRLPILQFSGSHCILKWHLCSDISQKDCKRNFKLPSIWKMTIRFTMVLLKDIGLTKPELDIHIFYLKTDYFHLWFLYKSNSHFCWRRTMQKKYNIKLFKLVIHLLDVKMKVTIMFNIYSENTLNSIFTSIA